MRFGKNIPGLLFIFLVCFALGACVNTATDLSVVAIQEDNNAEQGAGGKTTLWVNTLVSGLRQPWGMAFLPDGDILLTEKTGALKRINAADFSVHNIAGVPDTTDAGQGGLMDILVHPNFRQNGWLYLSYTIEENQRYSTRVIRAKLEGQKLVAPQILFTAQPFYPERRHFGSRLLLDDGYLYITVGDRGNRDLAQSLKTHNGKVIRLHEDGSVPLDNPFVGQDGARPEIWTYGHRNPQGIARSPLTGEVWITEHGPQGGDEVNRLERGGNYGWPLVTYGEEYGGGKIGIGTQLKGTIEPLTYYVPSIGTAGIDFYTGGRYPGWSNSLLVSGLHMKQISRLELDGDSLVRKTRLPMNMRVRDLQVGPDGLVYALVDGSRLVRLETGQP